MKMKVQSREFLSFSIFHIKVFINGCYHPSTHSVNLKYAKAYIHMHTHLCTETRKLALSLFMCCTAVLNIFPLALAFLQNTVLYVVCKLKDV